MSLAPAIPAVKLGLRRTVVRAGVRALRALLGLELRGDQQERFPGASGLVLKEAGHFSQSHLQQGAVEPCFRRRSIREVVGLAWCAGSRIRLGLRSLAHVR